LSDDRSSRNTGMGSGGTRSRNDISNNGAGDSADNIRACNNHDGVPSDDNPFCRVILPRIGSEEPLDRHQRRSGKSGVLRGRRGFRTGPNTRLRRRTTDLAPFLASPNRSATCRTRTGLRSGPKAPRKSIALPGSPRTPAHKTSKVQRERMKPKRRLFRRPLRQPPGNLPPHCTGETVSTASRVPRFLAFLWAINVGGRTMPMSEFCAQFVRACGLKKHSINEGEDVFYSPIAVTSRKATIGKNALLVIS
jgi:hypothetical protein